MSTSAGPQHGTADFKLILECFKAGEHKANTHNPKAIRCSDTEWEQKCDAVNFANGLRHIAATLHLRPPSQPLAKPTTASNPEPLCHQQPSQTYIAAPDPTVQPSGFEMMTDTNTLSTPKHFIAWVDTHENQNKHLTLHIHLLLAIHRHSRRASSPVALRLSFDASGQKRCWIYSF